MKCIQYYVMENVQIHKPLSTANVYWAMDLKIGLEIQEKGRKIEWILRNMQLLRQIPFWKFSIW